jgi:hypothetical protein
MRDSQHTCQPDLIEQIPAPEVIDGWLADAIRRADLLRSLLRVARRKAAYRRPEAAKEGGEECHA